MRNSQLAFLLLVLSAVLVLSSACETPAANPTIAAPTAAATVSQPTVPAPTAIPPSSTLTALPPTATPTEIPATTAAPTVMPTQTATAVPTAVPVISPTLQLAQQVNAGFVSAMGWSGDGITLTVRTQDAITQYNTSDLTASNTISPPFASQLFAISPDGTLVAGIAPDQSVQIWSAQSGESKVKLEGALLPSGAVFTPDGRRVATFSGDKIEIQVWDVATGKLEQTLSGFETAAPVYSAVFAPDNQTMAWVSRATVQFMDMASGVLGAKLQFEDFVSAAEFTPDSKAFVTVTGGTVNGEPGGVLDVWDVASGKKLRELTAPQYFTSLSVAPRGALLATAAGNAVMLWNWQEGGAAVSANATGQVAIVSFSQDGKRLASGDQDGNLILWQVTP